MHTEYVLSRYLVASDVISPDHHPAPSRLLFASRTGKSLLIKEKVYQHLLAGEFHLIDEATLDQLQTDEVLVPPTADEFLDLLEQNKQELREISTLSLTLQPTANCQLGCVYCGQQHVKKNLEDDTADLIIARVMDTLQRKRYKKLSISWYGGEPILAVKQIEHVSGRLIEQCEQAGIGYSASMITNGLSLKPDIYLRLQKHQIGHFQITLDGIGQTHDLMRPIKAGGGSFDIILRNLLDVTSMPEFAAHGSGVTVRVNINRQNHHKVVELIDLLADQGLAKLNVALDFHPVVDWGGNHADRDSLAAADFATLEIDWMLHAIRRGFKFNRILPGRTNAPCMVVMPDAEVYDAYGNIYPCYEFPYTPKYDSPKYKIGHIRNIDQVRNDKAVTREWYTDIQTGISPCPRCPLFPVCGGGCAKHWYNGETGCPTFKLNLQERLVLDYWMRRRKRSAQAATVG
ncbi:radical SAM/SPASM domain-containing protein [Chromobacterium vaccinii]|uniref:radical SAM/SPASM domain-containing protein n=1 Tax=Chromobacterium vaccinii TaxID=1108595 RepID=UPI001E3557E6|nr:radical SAM protein [Chromobacterium vaccinii]MCD4502310.1 SPASM domain-containing protein [Chromobacterium vaccinii]